MATRKATYTPPPPPPDPLADLTSADLTDPAKRTAIGEYGREKLAEREIKKSLKPDIADGLRRISRRIENDEKLDAGSALDALDAVEYIESLESRIMRITEEHAKLWSLCDNLEENFPKGALLDTLEDQESLKEGVGAVVRAFDWAMGTDNDRAQRDLAESLERLSRLTAEMDRNPPTVNTVTLTGRLQDSEAYLENMSERIMEMWDQIQGDR